MIVNWLLWLALLVGTIAFGWLVTRAWRVRPAAVRWLAALLSGLVGLALGAVTVLALVGMIKFSLPRGTPAPVIQVAGTPEQIARGQHLADAFCVECHSPTGDHPMIGGVDLGGDLGMPLGSLVSVNLTPGGPLQDYTDGEILRVLRQGADKDGRWLVFMSMVNAKYMSDEDLEAVIAFLRSQPAVEHPTQQPPDRPNLLAAVLLGAGMIPQGEIVQGPISAPPKAATVEYGQYILSYQDCRACHGPNLTGGTDQFAPRGPGLAMVKSWTQDQFIQTLRTGVDPTGHALGEVMPWKSVGRMDDEELTAMYLYIVSLF